MAADTAEWADDYIYINDVFDKIVRTSSGTLVGCAGEATVIVQFKAWAESEFHNAALKPEAMEKADEFGAIVVDPDGTIWLYDFKMRPYQYGGEYAVQGCCTEFSLALLLAGLTAQETVAMAIKHYSHVGGKVVSLRLHPEGEPVPDEPPTVQEPELDIPVAPPPIGSKEYYGLGRNDPGDLLDTLV